MSVISQKQIIFSTETFLCIFGTRFCRRKGQIFFIVFMGIRVPDCVAQNLPRDIDNYPAGSMFPALWKGVLGHSDQNAQNLPVS